MGRADVAPRKEEVLDVSRVKHAVGNAIWRGSRVERRGGFGGRSLEAAGVVVIHRPASVGYRIVEFSAGFDIVFGQRVGTDISARLALAGQKAHPFKFPVLRMVVAVVLYVIPYAEGDLQKLVAQLFGVVD